MNDEANGSWPPASPQARVPAPPPGDSGQPAAPFGAPPLPPPGHPAAPSGAGPAAWQSAPPPRQPDAAPPTPTPSSAAAEQEPIILVARMSDPVFVTTPATPAGAPAPAAVPVEPVETPVSAGHGGSTAPAEPSSWPSFTDAAPVASADWAPTVPHPDPVAAQPPFVAPSFVVPPFTDPLVADLADTSLPAFGAPSFTDPEPILPPNPTAANYFGDDQPFSSAPVPAPASPSPFEETSALDDPTAAFFADLLSSVPSAPTAPDSAPAPPAPVAFAPAASVPAAPAQPAPAPATSAVPPTSAADPFAGFGLTPSAPTTTDDEDGDGVALLGLERRERVKRVSTSPLDWAALVLAILVAPLGLLVSIAALVLSSRANGWTSGVAKAALGISIAFTLVLSGVGVVVGNNAKDQAAFDAIVAKSASWCSAIQADPATLASSTYGWPAASGSIGTNLKRMRAYEGFWTSLVAKAPSGIKAETQKIADGATGIIASLKSSRVLDDAANQSLMQQLVTASTIPSYVSTYCK